MLARWCLGQGWHLTGREGWRKEKDPLLRAWEAIETPLYSGRFRKEEYCDLHVELSRALDTLKVGWCLRTL